MVAGIAGVDDPSLTMPIDRGRLALTCAHQCPEFAKATNL